MTRGEFMFGLFIVLCRIGSARAADGGIGRRNGHFLMQVLL